jgi:hypothetical protein
MKRFLAAAALALAAAALTGPPALSAAPPTTSQLMRKITSLTQKVTKLQKRVTTLEDDFARLEADVASCFIATPVARFGGFADEGYVYQVGQTAILVSALDILDDTTGLVPGQDFGFFAEIVPECVLDAVGRSRASSRPHAFAGLGPPAWTQSQLHR